MKVSLCIRHIMSLYALAYSLSQSLCHMAYEPLGCITDTSNFKFVSKIEF